MSQILTICRIIEGASAEILKATLLFIDFFQDIRFHSKMKWLLQAYGLPKETVTAVIMSYKNMKPLFLSPDSDTDFFDIVTGVFQIDTWTYSPSSLARSEKTTSRFLRNIWQTDCKPRTTNTSFAWLPFSANTMFTYHPLFELFFHRSYLKTTTIGNSKRHWSLCE